MDKRKWSGSQVKVKSTIGEMALDSSGSPVGVVKMDGARAGDRIPQLLKAVIDEADDAAWNEIRGKIDYVYSNVDIALGRLDDESRFGDTVRAEVALGKRVLFKPNIVMPMVIDPATHGPGPAHMMVTSWWFVAALMRWFHDRLEISYHRMAVGDGGTAMRSSAVVCSRLAGREVGTEAVIEGRYGDCHGGWGFYFTRRYLADSHDPAHTDDPMRGHDLSDSATYLPPGRAGDRMIVYDLNRITADTYRGREVPVGGGDNFQEITLHKGIVGGDPADVDDRADYPGCVLVNVPRTRMHGIDLFTNVLKNIGIGLYPMELSTDGHATGTQWKYAVPPRTVPGMKARLPHSVWMPVFGEDGLPKRNGGGNYILTKTAGIKGTQVDVIRATRDQGTFMVHITETLQMIGPDGIVNEGLVFAAVDPVAVDTLCAGYVFKTVPMQEAAKARAEYNLPTDFFQKAPLLRASGRSIADAEDGYESPFILWTVPGYAASRGLGKQDYYVVGEDSLTGKPLSSVGGHLGTVARGWFSEMITSQIYQSALSPFWYHQRSLLSYLSANDELTGSSYHRQMLDAFDENGDGRADFDEMGRTGPWSFRIRLSGGVTHLTATEENGLLHGLFYSSAADLKYSDSKWNAGGHDFLRDFRLAQCLGVARMMSKAPVESADPLFPGLTWGKGKWPSFQYALRASVLMSLFGPLGTVGPSSLYGLAFQYADTTLNGGHLAEGGIDDYIEAVANGASPIDFVLHVPVGYNDAAGSPLPNVVETDDPAKILTAHFDGGKQVW